MKKLKFLIIVAALIVSIGVTALAAPAATKLVATKPTTTTTQAEDWAVERDALIEAQRTYYAALVKAGKLTQADADAKLQAYTESLDKTDTQSEVKPSNGTKSYSGWQCWNGNNAGNGNFGRGGHCGGRNW